MFDKYKYDKQYDKENYWHMNLTLPKEFKNHISDAAIECGLSKNGFVRQAIVEKLKRMERVG